MSNMKDWFIGLFATAFLVGLGCIAAWLVADTLLQILAHYAVQGVDKVDYME
jgi:hypothetical protein